MNQHSVDFNQIRLKYWQTKSRLRSLLYGAQLDEKRVLSAQDCPVGQWIYNQGLPRYAHLPRMQELEEVHQAIHREAARLVSLYRAGRMEEARQGLANVEELGARLEDLFDRLEAETQPPGGEAEAEAPSTREDALQLRELQKANEALQATIREQAAALQSTRERFGLVAKATNDAIWDWNLLTDQIWWNEGFTTLFGYRADDIEPSIESWYGRIHPEDQQRIVTGIHAVIDHGSKLWSDEYRFRKADGSYAYVLDRGYALHDAQGKPYRMLGSMQDVTERKRWEQALLESWQQFQTLSESIPQLLWTATPEGYVNYYNRQWYAYTGLNFEQSQGQRWVQAVHPDDLANLAGHWQQALRAGEPYQTEARFRGAAGTYRWFLVRALPLRDEQGNIRQWFGTDTDIHERKRAEETLQRVSGELAAANEELAAANEELSESNRQLARINQDLDNFVYTASHDLKAPILNVEGLLRALEKQLSDEARQNPQVGQMYELLYSSVNRFKNTIRDLTEVARISKESQEDGTRIAFAGVLDEVLNDLNPQIREAGAAIEIRLDCEATHGTRKNVKSVLYNLLSNAVKYRSPERELRVRISCRTQDHYHVFTVEDNGLGMDMRQEEKIFALFKRLHSHVEGTGIGLYIVKKIVENAGGRIEVESRVGEGSTFRVYFRQYPEGK